MFHSPTRHFLQETIRKQAIIFLIGQLLLQLYILLFEFLQQTLIHNFLQLFILHLEVLISLSELHVSRYVSAFHLQHITKVMNLPL